VTTLLVVSPDEEHRGLPLAREVDENAPVARDAPDVDGADGVEDLALESVIGCLAAPTRKVLLDPVDLPANVGTKLVIGGLRFVGPPNVEPDRVGQLLLPPPVARRCT